MPRSDQRAAKERRCQHVDCGRSAVRSEIWRIDEASVRVQLCAEHSFTGAGARQVSGDRWATRTRA